VALVGLSDQCVTPINYLVGPGIGPALFQLTLRTHEHFTYNPQTS
jgi:hypothetical protein